MTDDPAARLRAELGELAATRRRAERARARAMTRTRPAVIEGHLAGIGPSELATLTGLSRRAIYDILGLRVAPDGTTHAVGAARQLRHPGGKDGLWVAACLAGDYESGPTGTREQAEQCVREHATGKTGG